MAWLQLYARILFALFALAGVVSLIGLQAGWLAPGGIERSPQDQEDDSGLETAVEGPFRIWSQLIPIDPGLTYELSAEVRVFSPNDDIMAGTRTYLGVETLDADLKPLRSGPGSYRYGAAANRIIQPVSGWVTLSGLMTGEGDDRHSQFRPGTRYVRVVLLLNYQRLA